jgi:hypothetical protein
MRDQVDIVIATQLTTAQQARKERQASYQGRLAARVNMAKAVLAMVPAQKVIANVAALADSGDFQKMIDRLKFSAQKILIWTQTVAA